MNLESLSDADLEAIASGNLESLSDDTLAMLAGESTTSSQDTSSRDKTVIPTLAAGMIGAQGSSLKEESVFPALSGVLNEFTGGAIQNPRSYALGGPVSANVAVGEDLIGMLTGKQDRDVGLYTPKTLGGNIVQTGAAVAAGAGMAALPDAVSGFIKGMTSGTRNAIQATRNISNNLLNEIDGIKGLLANEASRVNRVEGTAQTFLNMAQKEADATADVSKSLIGQRVSEGEQLLREKATSAARLVREKAVGYSRKIGESFNEDYLKAIKGKKVSEDDAYAILHQTVKDAGLLDEAMYNPSKWSSAEAQVYKIFNKYAGVVRESAELKSAGKGRPTVNIPLEDFDRDIRDVVGAFRGKQWGSGEHILTDLRRNASQILSSQYKDLNPVNAKWGEKFKLRNALFQRVRPFDKTGDASKAVDSFADSLFKASNGQMTKRLNEYDTISKFRSELNIPELEDVFSHGSKLQNEKLSINMIDELNSKAKLQQQNEVDSFIARQKSDLEQMSLRENARLEGKTRDLESQQSVLDALIQKEKRIGDLAWKVAGGAGAMVGAGGTFSIGKALSKVVNSDAN